jgi:hypothetical protein
MAGLGAAQRRAEELGHRLERQDPLWPAHLTVLVVILLGLALPAQLTIGRWWVFGVELALLVGLVVTTPHRLREEEGPRRIVRIALVSLVSVANVLSLLLLAERLVAGIETDGPSLLAGGIILWCTALLLFAVWFWELDRGGPLQRHFGDLAEQLRHVHFLFPQMVNGADLLPGWVPGYNDYLYLSLTNAASFAPPETMPVTKTAQLLMGLQSLASLATTVIVLAYAVNNLG